MAFENERMEDGKWQTIDWERNVALQMVGHVLHEPIEFRLDIENTAVHFKAFQDIKQLGGSYAIEWRVINMTAASNLELDKSRLHTLIEESLDAYGFAASRKIIDSVSVTFATNLLTT